MPEPDTWRGCLKKALALVNKACRRDLPGGREWSGTDVDEAVTNAREALERALAYEREGRDGW